MQFLSRDRRMLFRVIAEIPEPDQHPGEADDTDDDEGKAPAERHHQQRDDRRRDRGAKAGEGMGQPLRIAALLLGHPALHGPCRGREGRALAETEQQAEQEERTEATDEAGADGRRRPDQPTPEQAPPRPEPVGNPAAANLEQQIRIGEGREDQAEFRVRKMQVVLDTAGGRADIHAVDIGDEIHCAEQREHDIRRLYSGAHDRFFPCYFWRRIFPVA